MICIRKKITLLIQYCVMIILGKSFSQPGGVKRVPTSGGQRDDQLPSAQTMNRGGPTDVEQAEEAQPSPDKTSTTVMTGKTIVENITPAKEVAFEDLSKKANKLLSGTRELFQASRGSASSKDTSQQGTVSPRRVRSSSGSEALIQGSGSASPSSDRSRASSRGSVKGGRDRAGSCPSPEPSTDSIAKQLASQSFTVTKLSNVSRRGWTGKSGSNHSSDSDSPTIIRRMSSKESAGPKSLTPALAPSVSLVKSCDVSSLSDRMNVSVVPPADEHSDAMSTIGNLQRKACKDDGVSTTTNVSDDTKNGKMKDDGKEQDRFKFTPIVGEEPDTKLTTTPVVGYTDPDTAPKELAAEELRKLLRRPRDAYSCYEDNVNYIEMKKTTSEDGEKD